MVVIFGFGPGEAQDLGEVAPLTCPNCHNEVFLHYLRSKKAIRLYFVPVVPYGTDEYLLCPVCRQGLQLQAAKRATVEQMQARTRAFRRGKAQADLYHAQVEQFWRALGFGAAGAGVPRVPPGVSPPGVSPPGVSPPGMAAPLARPAQLAPVPPGPAPAAQAAGPSLATRLAELGKLHADGVLTDDEFAAAKRRILGG